MSFRDQKVDLLKWANDQVHLPSQTKAVLKELASFADADGCAWAKVATLAYAVNLKERQVQNHLERLRADGAVRLSGRMHRLKKSTRSVPVYQLAPALFDGLDEAAAGGFGAAVEAVIPADCMGAEDCTHRPEHGCNREGGMGAAGCTPHRRPLGDQSGAKAPSPGARDLAALFEQLEAATPRRVLKFTDRDEAFAAFGALAEAGVEVEWLAECARRMAADPDFKSRKHPPPLEDWLGKRQFRGWWPADDADASAAVGHPADGQGVPAEIVARFLAVAEAGKVGSYLRPCAYEPGPPGRLLARTSMALAWLQGQRAVLEELGLVVEFRGRA